jgi:hypothetical protein
MKLAIMQPYFFPYIGYYQAISAVDKYILYDQLNYIKDKYMNRNRILVVNGKPTYFNVCIKEKSSFTKIADVEISYEKKWRKNILLSLYMNYKRSTYFNEVYPVVENVINTDTNLLTTLNARSVIDICKYLDINTEIITDVHGYLELELKLSGTDEEVARYFPYAAFDNLERKVVRVIEICKREEADVFVNAIGGQALYSKDEFAHQNISLFFIKTDDITYSQRSTVFFPNLSIIDVLMNCGKDKTNELIQQYKLV